MAEDAPAVATAAVKERKILVAVDESKESINALSWCLKNVISQNSKDTVILLYVKPPRAVYTSLDGTGYLFSSDILATMEKYSKDVADCIIEKATRMCREHEACADVSFILFRGSGGDESREWRSKGCDLPGGRKAGC
ncbi:uncharacterized protein LOC126671055 [Mercurialis annua]|uniref:uncharacterized protein LOC126671055 n=1 Tax=Mercurialis annua TaxID=3986 RepID=UPI00215F0632|nr:uncharacterized protein LOC126671055 [Mercurialis annua]